MSTYFRISLTIVSTTVCLFIALFTQIKSNAQTLILKNNTLKVCSDAGFLPFEMKNSSGEWVGFDIDMMKDFTKSLHLKLEMIQINFNGIIPALLSGKCDMVAAGMTVTPSRKKVVSFSSPTFQNGLSIAVKNTEGGKIKYTNLASLDKQGIKIAVKTGYTSDIYLTKNLKKAQILRFDEDSDLYLALKQDRADAFMSDATYVSVISKENANQLTILPTSLTAEEYSAATRLQDKILMQEFNKFLAQWKLSPAYKQAYNKYFLTSS